MSAIPSAWASLNDIAHIRRRGYRGGIVGAACAAEAARAGLRVVVIEARMIGGGATAAGMGHIVVMDDSEAQFALTRYSQSLWDQLSQKIAGRLRVRNLRHHLGRGR